MTRPTFEPDYTIDGPHRRRRNLRRAAYAATVILIILTLALVLNP